MVRSLQHGSLSFAKGLGDFYGTCCRQHLGANTNRGPQYKPLHAMNPPGPKGRRFCWKPACKVFAMITKITDTWRVKWT